MCHRRTVYLWRTLPVTKILMMRFSNVGLLIIQQMFSGGIHCLGVEQTPNSVDYRGYDNGSNNAGMYKGAQAIIFEHINLAFYNNCAHTCVELIWLNAVRK